MTAVIKTKAYALIRNGDRILLEAIPEVDGTIIGYRPLGGSVEFGEKAEDAVVREFVEELSEKIQVGSLYCVGEEIFQYNNQPGHEVMFIFEAEFLNKDLYKEDSIIRTDTIHDIPIKAEWLNPHHLPNGLPLFPADLAAEIGKHHHCCH